MKTIVLMPMNEKVFAGLTTKHNDLSRDQELVPKEKGKINFFNMDSQREVQDRP